MKAVVLSVWGRFSRDFSIAGSGFGVMSKKSSTCGGLKKGSKSDKASVGSPEEMGTQKYPVSIASNGDIQIPIHVKPGAKSNCITDVCSDYWSIQIAAPPTDGEANTALVKFFADLLKLRKSDVDLRGGKSRDKVITISKTATACTSDRKFTCDQVHELLKTEIGKLH